jgi:hypothetical protein
VIEQVLDPEHPDTLALRADIAHWTRQARDRGRRPPNARRDLFRGRQHREAAQQPDPDFGPCRQPARIGKSLGCAARCPAARPGSCFQRAREDRRGRSSLRQHNGQASCCEASARAAREGPARQRSVHLSCVLPSHSVKGKPSPWRRSVEAQPRVIGMLRPPVRPAAAGRTAQSRSPAPGTRPVRPAAALAVSLIRGPGLPRTAVFCRVGRRVTCIRQRPGPSCR